jgi:hypothetical protein
MSEHHPTKGKHRGGAFVAGDASFLAAVVHPPRALTGTPLTLLKTRHLIRPTKADGEDLDTNEHLAKEPHPSSPR